MCMRKFWNRSTARRRVAALSGGKIAALYVFVRSGEEQSATIAIPSSASFPVENLEILLLMTYPPLGPYREYFSRENNWGKVANFTHKKQEKLKKLPSPQKTVVFLLERSSIAPKPRARSTCPHSRRFLTSLEEVLQCSKHYLICMRGTKGICPESLNCGERRSHKQGKKKEKKKWRVLFNELPQSAFPLDTSSSMYLQKWLVSSEGGEGILMLPAQNINMSSTRKTLRLSSKIRKSRFPLLPPVEEAIPPVHRFFEIAKQKHIEKIRKGSTRLKFYELQWRVTHKTT